MVTINAIAILINSCDKATLSHDWGGEIFYDMDAAVDRCEELHEINENEDFIAVPCKVVIDKRDLPNRMR